jgi:hypothetical protein
VPISALKRSPNAERDSPAFPARASTFRYRLS